MKWQITICWMGNSTTAYKCGMPIDTICFDTSTFSSGSDVGNPRERGSCQNRCLPIWLATGVKGSFFRLTLLKQDFWYLSNPPMKLRMSYCLRVCSFETTKQLKMNDSFAPKLVELAGMESITKTSPQWASDSITDGDGLASNLSEVTAIGSPLSSQKIETTLAGLSRCLMEWNKPVMTFKEGHGHGPSRPIHLPKVPPESRLGGLPPSSTQSLLLELPVAGRLVVSRVATWGLAKAGRSWGYDALYPDYIQNPVHSNHGNV